MEVSLNTGGCSNVGITYTDSAAFMCLSADFFVFRVFGAVIFVYFLFIMTHVSRTKDTINA
jgi:hypothetical protein